MLSSEFREPASAGPTALVTRRLVLRPPRASDLDTLAALHADPAVNRFCAAATPQGRPAVEAQLQSWVSHWQAHGFGHWAIAEREQPHALIGFGGLMHRSVAGHAGLYLYYRITPQAWGRGLASEMAQQAMVQAFDQRHEGAVVAAVLLLAFAGFGWVMTSASLILTMVHHPVVTPVDFLRHVVLTQDGPVFEVWLALGALLAAPVFASSVVTLPLLLDRQVGVLAAVFISWRVVMEHPVPMALWAALLMGLSLLGMASMMVGPRDGLLRRLVRPRHLEA